MLWMIIIHFANAKIAYAFNAIFAADFQRIMNAWLPRLAAPCLAERLRVMPAVIVTGARQAGKSTLAQQLAPGQRRFVSFDDWDVADVARRDPDVLLDARQPLTVDEVQREPSFLHALKRAIDRQRQAGRFLLTGSANLRLMAQVSESLAGRASYLTLWPMTRREQLGLGRSGIWDELLAAPAEQWLELVQAQTTAAEDWRAWARRGGFPAPALQLATARDRAIWFDGYVQTYLERDLRQLSAISSLPDFRRLIRATCLRVGQVTNQTALGRDAALPQATVHRYLNLLETSYLLVRLPAYAVNRTKRLIKSPKTYWSDTGLALHIAQAEPLGAHLENLVLQDLLAWRDARLDRVEIAYWRTTNGAEVDFVIEAGPRLLPIEIKSTRRPRLRDTAHLRAFQAEYGPPAAPGLLLHDGTVREWIAPDVLAAPWWSVL